MSGNDKLEKRKRTTRNICVLITVVFIIVMLILPLFSIIVSSLKEGVGFYIKAVTTSYVLSALKVTFIATFVALVINTLFGIIAAWVLTRFDFKGKQVLATLIDIPFSISPVIVGLAFLMTFPYVSREIIPVLNSLGKDEEEAAALMGADGFTIFFKITLPNIKWSLIYGIILCTSRALGEFGAVNALSKTRGETFTLPLEIDALYMSGTDSSITAAFAVSSILVIIAVIVLILKNVFEYRQKNAKKGGVK